MAEREIFYRNNDNLLTLTDLKDAANEININGASVSVTVVDAATEDEIVGETWPVTMSYVNESNGTYRATLSHELVVDNQQVLIGIVTVDAGEGLYMSLRVPILVLEREGE